MKNKVVSVLTMVYGGLEAAFGLFSLLGIFMQRLMMRATPSFSHPNFHGGSLEFWLRIEITHNVWLVFMPFLIVLGFLFVVSGYQLYKNKGVSVPLIRVSSLSIILWFVLYAVINVLWLPYITRGFELNHAFLILLMILSMVMSFVMTCGYPVFLLFYLPRISRTNEPSLRQGASGP